MRIYLDYNAGAPLRPEAVAAVERAMRETGGNPSSVHRAGQRARRALERARAQVASLVGASPREIVFTSGGTESNNLAIAGVAKLAGHRRRIITSEIEHSSIRAPVAELESRGFEIIRIMPDSDGRIWPANVIGALNGDTALVTLGLVNSEVGAIQDLAPIAAHTSRVGAVFHVDAAQAAGRIPLGVAALGCDLMTLSGHKLGAPAGVGALWVRSEMQIAPLLMGGPQEGGLRAGTQNLLGAVAFGAAAEAALAAMAHERARVESLADSLLARLTAAIAGLVLNGPLRGRIRSTLNLTFPGVLGESMLIALDLEGVEVSMGSACAAGAVEPSHVLLAMGRSRADARSSLRISLGWNTTAAEIEAAAEIIPRVWRRVGVAEPVTAPAELPR